MTRLSLRTRLTLIYGGLFLFAGLVLMTVTYALVEKQLPMAIAIRGGGGVTGPPPGSGPPPQGVMLTFNGVRVSPEEYPGVVREKALATFVTQGAIALGVVGAASVGFGWLLAGRALQPLHRVTDTARRIANAPAADRGLHERISLVGPRDEVKELADTFDHMLYRLDQSFEGQRRFVANASHELRTPLTLNRALIEVAMHRRTASEDVKQLGETLLDVNARHERLINGLLLLARSESGVSERSEVDLAEIARHVTAQTMDEATTAGVRLEVTTEPAPTAGDPVLLERLVQNLVQNGVRHNAPDGWVTVHTGQFPNGQVVLTVVNTGPAVPAYEIPSLFEPFRRLDRERLVTSRGVGLGLSIVRSVARAHGGDVSAQPREGGGLIVRVTLPQPDPARSRPSSPLV